MVRRYVRRIAKTALWVVSVLLFLFCIQIGILAFPQVLLSNCVSVGTVVIHSDAGSDSYLESLASKVEHRLSGSRFYDSTRTDAVYYIQDQGFYELFTTLARQPGEAQGFALSFLGNSFVSKTRVAALGAGSGHLPKYSIWEGDPAHTIAHEIGHLYVTDRIGRERWRQLPQWKQEGFPEYIANIDLISEDSSATLPMRIAILNDDANWNSTLSWSRHDRDRIHYEAGLLVEFLLDVRNLSMEDILADSVTRETALADMVAWAKEQGSRLVL